MAEGIACQFKALVAVAEHSSLFPTNYMAAHTGSENPFLVFMEADGHKVSTYADRPPHQKYKCEFDCFPANVIFIY